MDKRNRRTIIVSGNCQASFIYKTLVESPILHGEYRLLRFRNFKTREQQPLEMEDFAKCAVLLEQISHQAPPLANKEHIPADCRVITFPILWMNILWPMEVNDPRNKPTEQYPAGPFPYGDRTILESLDAGDTPEKAARRWLEMNIGEKADLQRYYEINLAKAEQLDQRADIPFGKYVYDNFREKQLFVTRNHPSPPMLRYMRQTIYDALDVPAPESDLSWPSGGMGDIHVPIHPTVAEHFNLRWYDPESTYKYFSEQLTPFEYYRRYAAFT